MFLPPPPNASKAFLTPGNLSSSDGVVDALNQLSEPSLSSLGLGGFWPSGIVQTMLEYIHVNLTLPWWSSIVLLACFFRLLMTPIALQQRIQTLKMHNSVPDMKETMQRLKEATERENVIEALKIHEEINKYMQSNNLKMLSLGKFMLLQAPIFISVYYGIRGMAYLPVESLKSGGLAWFSDLTLSDPFFIMPLFNILTMYLMIEFGSDGPGVRAMPPPTKWLLRAMPLVAFAFIHNFPAAIVLYWTTSNVYSLVQLCVFQSSFGKKLFGIPTVDQKANKISPDYPTLSMKETMAMFQKTNEMMERIRLHDKKIEKREELRDILDAAMKQTKERKDMRKFVNVSGKILDDNETKSEEKPK